jgi:protein SCO1/2
VEKSSSLFPESAAHSTGLLRTFSASFTVLVVGLVLMLLATGGGRAFTTETARREAVDQSPQAVPPFALTRPDGQGTTLAALLATGERVWIVDFVYTRCQTLCSVLGTVYQQLQQRIVDEGLSQQVGLLSISFDPGNDDPAALRVYEKRMGMKAGVWEIVTLTSPQDRRRLLDAFGIMVLPAPLGEFEHNAALHIIDQGGLLVKIVDLTEPALALEWAKVLVR